MAADDWHPHGQALEALRLASVHPYISCREVQPQALARLVGWKVTLSELAPRSALLEERAESCRSGRSCEAEAAGSAKEYALTN